MNTPKIILFLAFIFFSFSFQANADEVDKFVRNTLAERHIPGAAIAVIKNGKIVKMQGYGIASVEFKVPVTKDTVFEIGSVSKQLTAAGIMLLVEDGKIDLDAKIAKYLPSTPDSWKNVTVRNLLTHTSGIKSYSSLDGFEVSRGLNRDTFIKALSPHPLDFETGTSYVYSNSGYSLLSYIIESVSGKNYWDFIRERIFSPLGMTKTANRNLNFVIPNRATGYEWEKGQLTGRDYNLTDLTGAGAIVSTISDLAKWGIALRNDTLLKKTSREQMWTPLAFTSGKTYRYGFAFRFSDIRGHKLVAHSGQTSGFGASLSRYEDDDLTVIALTNLGENGMGTLIAQGVAKFYIPAISLKVMKAKADDAKITQTVKAALNQRLENKPTAELFTEAFIRSISGERARANNQRIASFGTVNNVVFVGDEVIDGKKIFRYKAETAKRIFLWRFAFDNEEKISEMTLEEEE